MKVFKIIIADDHDLIRQGLKSLLAGHQEYDVVSEAFDGEDAVAKVSDLKPDILLLDITMPRCSGLEAIRSIKDVSPDTKIIIISVHKSEPYIAKALSLGVKGYLIKDDAAEELISALAKVCRDKVYVSSAVSMFLMDNVSRTRSNSRDGMELTPREKDVLRLVAEGKTAKEISETLFVSHRTVENNKNALLKKFNLHRTVDLVKYAVENNLID